VAKAHISDGKAGALVILAILDKSIFIILSSNVRKITSELQSGYGNRRIDEVCLSKVSVK
jgi:hypothetical protein